MTDLLISNASVLDPADGSLEENLDVRVVGDMIEEVDRGLTGGTNTIRIDAAGRVLLPGLIDAHVHVMAAVNDHGKLSNMPPYLVAAYAKEELAAMLRRGFTTIRDAGGAEGGLAQAVELGLFPGPRIFPSGLALAQSYGLGDFRARPEVPLGCPTCHSTRTITRVVDGVDEVRRACREEFASGATQIKVMASGGNSGPTPILTPHFNHEEISTAVEEARAMGSYVMAHAYGPEAIQRAIAGGVRTIEHANLIDHETAAVVAESNAYVVPTLSTFEASLDYSDRLGMDEALCDQVRNVLDSGVAALRMCRDLGVKIGFGTDLEGFLHDRHLREFPIRAQVETPAEILNSVLTVNAEILQRAGRLGTIAPGAAADILVVDGNPLDSVDLFQEDGRNIRVTVAQGRIYKNELAADLVAA